MGACDVRTCAGPVSPKAPLVDAGTITISGAGETLPLFSQSGSYTSANNQNMTWTAGALFSVTATGAAGGVPAFTASVSVPASLDLVSPTVLTDVSRSNDLTMEWTGDEAGTNAMAFIQSPSLSARCTVPSRSHKVVVPQAVLALAPPSESGQVFLRASRTQTLRTGSAQVDVTAFVNRGSWNVTFH